MKVPTEKKKREEKEKLPLHWLGDASAASTSIPSCATRARLAGVVSALWAHRARLNAVIGSRVLLYADED
jgi:hypothetical protein